MRDHKTYNKQERGQRHHRDSDIAELHDKALRATN